MPAAIDFATLAGISPRHDGQDRHLFGELLEGARLRGRRSARSGQPALERLPARRHHDSRRGRPHIPGFSLSLWGDVPLGSGLSSSAALEVATALAVTSLSGSPTPVPLSPGCASGREEFVGANCGIMDQFISANGAKDHALLLDCRDLSYRLAPIPPGVALVIANTMVKHAVSGGEYTSRRAEVEEAAAVIARHRPAVRFCATQPWRTLRSTGRR